MKFEITNRGIKSPRLNQQQAQERLIDLCSADPEEQIDFECFSEAEPTRSILTFKLSPVKFVTFSFLALKKLNQLREHAGGFEMDILQPFLEDSETSASAHEKAMQVVSQTANSALVDLGFSQRIHR